MPRVVRVDEDLAEAAGEGLVLLGVDLLVAEEDHAVLVERLADFGDDAVVEILGDIDAADLGAACAGDRRISMLLFRINGSSVVKR